MGVCVRSDNVECSEWFKVGRQLLRHGYVLSPLLLFKVFFATVPIVRQHNSSSEPDVLKDLVHLKEDQTTTGSETVPGKDRRCRVNLPVFIL